MEELKIQMEIEQANVRGKIMEGREQKFGETANQEDLGNKPSEKIQLPEKDVNQLCENSLESSTTEGNQRHSKPPAENESRDEGQEGVTNIFFFFLCILFFILK